MKYLALITLSSILVSCSSTKPAKLITTNSNHKAPVTMGQTWMETLSKGASDKRAPASVKDSELKELIKAMNTYTGWKTMPVGKAITREESFYVDGQSQSELSEKLVLKQGMKSYFDLVKLDTGYALEVTAIDDTGENAVKNFKDSMTSLKKTGPALYTMGFKLEDGDFKAFCELKMDLNKSSVFFNSSCKDPQGRLIQESKVVTTKDVNVKDFSSQLENVAINVCPSELIGENIRCVDGQKQDWSYLVK